VRVVKEIRWHARAGQGAKTASQLLAVSALHAGKSVQAFPEYGPERRGAPMRAYTRIDDEPIRRHDSVTTPDVVVVLEPSLLGDNEVTDGLAADGLLLVNSDEPLPGHGHRVVAVPASRIAQAHGSKFANLVMVGAVAAAVGDLDADTVADSAVELLGKKGSPQTIRAAVIEGYRCLN
jgi:pyruvate ferredoxin oxidoreductase gamma subunit